MCVDYYTIFKEQAKIPMTTKSAKTTRAGLQADQRKKQPLARDGHIFYFVRKKIVYFQMTLVHVVGLRRRGWCNCLAVLTF
jgi:hypothetical protein